MATISKTQIDRLGDRLRRDPASREDLIVLDSYRRSFGEAYEAVVQELRHTLALEVTGRPAKSTNSIVEKLKRESIRLTQVQDIAGCRVVVTDSVEQEHVVSKLLEIFPGAGVMDRRKTPSYGYRAVHIVVKTSDKLVELQIRTRLQHLWAEVSEKYGDLFGSEIKYGGGDEQLRELLKKMSDLIGSYEDLELSMPQIAESDQKTTLQTRLANFRAGLLNDLNDVIVELSLLKRTTE
jgi:ppGpp synthetase/RelA/SpoT-type nucleotidyltranferase